MAYELRQGLAGNLAEHPTRAQLAKTFVRFANKFRIDETTGCWQWIAAKQSNGYGRIWNGERTDYAHRAMYELFHGSIPDGLDIDHICRNRSCVNPLHLEPVTRSENLRRGDAGENIAEPLRAKTHCPYGHPYSGSNLTIRAGRRHCKACARIRYHRNKRRSTANG